MRYVGGKYRIAKPIAQIVNNERKRLEEETGDTVRFWEPFCGGLSVSVQLAQHGPGLVSDACGPLINLYQAIREGWSPPTFLSKADWYSAKGLPDSDPLKAYAGFCASYGAKYFGGYATEKKGKHELIYSKRVLARDIPLISACDLQCLDFMDVQPVSSNLVIYCDPPYAGTQGYMTGKFDHFAFWERCRQWEQLGVPVFVSELSCPLAGAEVVWEKPLPIQLSGGTSQKRQNERLYRVHKGTSQ